MKKRILSVMLTAAMLAVVPANQSVWAGEATAEETTAEEITAEEVTAEETTAEETSVVETAAEEAAAEESTAEVTEASEAEEAAQEEAVITTDTEDYRLLNEEGTVIQGDGYSIEINWCGEEGQRLYGRTYYPEDFDPEKKYTTVVLNHGGSVNADIWDKCYAPNLARNGFVCYAFDCRSCTEGGRGSYSDPTETGTATVETYSEDLNTAIDFMKTRSFVDTENLFLMGQSMGGLTVQNVAGTRSDEIAGLIVLYGSLGDDNQSMVENYEELKASPYQGEVLFIQGAQDANLPIDRTLENMEWYEESSIVYINTAYHGFGNQDDRPSNLCVEDAVSYIHRMEEKSEEMAENPTAATEEDLLADEEGYLVTGEDYYSVVEYCGEEGSSIFGRMYYPSDFDESQTYPALVLCHSGNGNADLWDDVYAPLLAAEGYLCYAIDCQSAASGGRGSYGDALESGEATVETYADNVSAALDFVESKDYVNKETIYLAGASMGGIAVQIVGSERSEEIKGLIVLYGSLGDDIGAEMLSDYDEIKNNPFDNGEVLFVQGTEDPQCVLSRTLENMEWYPLSSLTAISGTGHGFGYQMDRASLICKDNILEFLYRTINNIGAEED